MDELDILKEEMASLRRNLDKEQIVNDKLLRTVMRQKASWLNTFVKVEILTMPLIYLIFVVICAGFRISQWYAFAFLIMGLIDSLVDLRTFRISPKIFSTCSMLEVRNILKRQKRERFIHLCVALPAAIIWLMLLSHAILNATMPNAEDHALNIGGAIGGVIGGVIGAILVIIIFRKAQKTNDVIIEDTGEF